MDRLLYGLRNDSSFLDYAIDEIVGIGLCVIVQEVYGEVQDGL